MTDTITIDRKVAEQVLEALWNCTVKLESQQFRNTVQIPPVYSDIIKAGYSAHAALRAAIEAAKKAEPVRCCNHDSDCAVHNEPAYPSGPCNCSVSRPEQNFRYKFLDRAALDAWIASNAVPLHDAPQPAIPEGWVELAKQVESGNFNQAHVIDLARRLRAAAPKKEGE